MFTVDNGNRPTQPSPSVSLAFCSRQTIPLPSSASSPNLFPANRRATTTRKRTPFLANSIVSRSPIASHPKRIPSFEPIKIQQGEGGNSSPFEIVGYVNRGEDLDPFTLALDKDKRMDGYKGRERKRAEAFLLLADHRINRHLIDNLWARLVISNRLMRSIYKRETRFRFQRKS